MIPNGCVTAAECTDPNFGDFTGFTTGLNDGTGHCNVDVPVCYHPYSTNPATCDRNCFVGTLYIAASDMCIEECPLGFYYDGDGEQCSPCGENCVSCSSAFNCDLCEAGAMTIFGENTCFYECRAGFYNSWNNGPRFDQEPYCRECHSTCSECFWSGPADCLECWPGQFVESDYIYDLFEKGVAFEDLPLTQ